jgi:YggT family protein
MATELIIKSLVNFINIYQILIVIRLLLSWFQTANWAYQGISFLSPITDPYLDIFRSFIPPIGGIDFISPTLAIFSLSILAQLIGGGSIF